MTKRDIPALIEALRVRALALTGAEWERNATRDMMNEAAQRLEELAAYRSVVLTAYRSVVLTCEMCKHWKAVDDGWSDERKGVCRKMSEAGEGSKAWAELYDAVLTTANFGCVMWEAK